MNLHRWTVVVFVVALGCKAKAPSPSSPPRQATTVEPAASPALLAAKRAIETVLPETASPFTAATPVHYGKGYVRRAYANGNKRVAITIARYGQDPGAFERWVAESANYPQAQLSLPTALAGGFFSCATKLADSPCDLHIRLRSGFHVEVMGNGQVPRADLAQLVTHVKLAELTDTTLAVL